MALWGKAIHINFLSPWSRGKTTTDRSDLIGCYTEKDTTSIIRKELARLLAQSIRFSFDH